MHYYIQISRDGDSIPLYYDDGEMMVFETHIEAETAVNLFMVTEPEAETFEIEIKRRDA